MNNLEDLNALVKAAVTAIKHNKIEKATRFILAASAISNEDFNYDSKIGTIESSYDINDSFVKDNEFGYLPAHDFVDNMIESNTPYYVKLGQEPHEKYSFSGYWVDDDNNDLIPPTDEPDDVLLDSRSLSYDTQKELNDKINTKQEVYTKNSIEDTIDEDVENTDTFT